MGLHEGHKRKWIWSQGRQLGQKYFCLPYQWGCTLDGRNLLHRIRFFPFRVDSIPLRAWCTGKQTRNYWILKKAENLPDRNIHDLEKHFYREYGISVCHQAQKLPGRGMLLLYYNCFVQVFSAQIILVIFQTQYLVDSAWAHVSSY